MEIKQIFYPCMGFFLPFSLRFVLRIVKKFTFAFSIGKAIPY